MTISAFQGPYRFLSNFYGLSAKDDPVRVTLDGIMFFPTVEHAYVAAKLSGQRLREEVLRLETAGQAKRFLRDRGLREPSRWKGTRLGIMECLLRQKFAPRSALAEKLLATAPEALVEGNAWGDTFWGVCSTSGVGKNHLGRLLVFIRDDLSQA